MNRINKAAELFGQGYNCSQAVVCAYCDSFGISAEDGKKLSAGFGAGVGGLRGECGAVSGMVILAGLKYGNYDSLDDETKKKFYALVRQMHAEFEKVFGTTNCKELLEKHSIKPQTDPSERTKEYYTARPCPKFVEQAAMIVEEFLL